MENKQKLNINDIPQDVREQILRTLRETGEYKNLVKQRSRALMCGNPVKAMALGRKVTKLEQTLLEEYLKLCDWECKSIAQLRKSMSKEDEDLLNACGNAIIMLSDALETLIIESNSLLKKYHPGYRIEMFDKLNELAKEARKHVSMLDQYANDEFYTNTYGDTVDKLYEMILNKAKSFVRKMQRHETKSKHKKTV